LTCRGWSWIVEVVTIDDELAKARAHLTRVPPAGAAAAQAEGALLVDIRPVHQRAADGEIPGALVIERNVLEWRLDPQSPDRIPEIDGPDQVVVVVCDAGYASSLAAASLQSVGLPHATDLDGGYQAWRAAGLPTTPSAR
jgi:rhodanese-related sulfurtransferase